MSEITNEEFQPVLVSWKTPDYAQREIKVICTRQIELDFFRHELEGIEFYEQRIYSVSDEGGKYD